MMLKRLKEIEARKKEDARLKEELKEFIERNKDAS